MDTDINNSQDIIDSRQVEERIEELEELEEALEEAETAMHDHLLADEEDQNSQDYPQLHTDVVAASKGFDDEEQEELKALRSLRDQASGYASDWPYGETLIRHSYFTEYAKQLADDLGAITDDASWPYTHIDWEDAAADLKQDYTEVDFDGVAYFIR